MKIVIGGLPGAGKSTLAKKLAEKLGYNFYSMGNIRRQIAKDKGLTLEEYNKECEQGSAEDEKIDNKVKEIGLNEDNFVIDSRTAFHFIPDAKKIFLTVEPKEGAQRIWADLNEKGLAEKRNEANQLKTVEAVEDNVKKRVESDKKRYQEYYGFDAYDSNNYDFVIDTTGLKNSETLEKALELIK